MKQYTSAGMHNSHLLCIRAYDPEPWSLHDSSRSCFLTRSVPVHKIFLGPRMPELSIQFRSRFLRASIGRRYSLGTSDWYWLRISLRAERKAYRLNASAAACNGNAEILPQGGASHCSEPSVFRYYREELSQDPNPPQANRWDTIPHSVDCEITGPQFPLNFI